MRKSRPAPARRRTPRQLTARITGDRRAAEILQLEMRRLARRLGLTVIVEGDIVRIHRDHQRAAGTPTLIAVPRRRGRAPASGDSLSATTGWKEVLDEKKMRRS
jgi:hypothetical protein